MSEEVLRMLYIHLKNRKEKLGSFDFYIEAAEKFALLGLYKEALMALDKAEESCRVPG